MLNKMMTSFVVTAALTASLGLAACGGSSTPAQSTNAPAATETTTTETTSKQAPAATENTSQQQAPAATENTSQQQAPAATESTPAPAPSSNASADSYIGDQAAMDIALQNAGFAAGDVYDLEVELDLDDPNIHYDVSFKQGNTEYDYDIDAFNGTILNSYSEIDD